MQSQTANDQPVLTDRENQASKRPLDSFTFGRPGILQEQETSPQEAFSDVPNQISSGGPQQSQPAPHSSQTSAKKRDLDTDDHNPCRKRINAERHCKYLDTIKNPSLSISEVTQSHTATAEVPRTPVASSDWMTEVEMATDSASTNTAGCQRSNLASHPENIMDVASSIARSTPSYKTNTKVSETDSGKSHSSVGSMQTTDQAFKVAQTCKTVSKPSGISAVQTGHRSSVKQTLKALTQDKRMKIITISHTADSP